MSLEMMIQNLLPSLIEGIAVAVAAFMIPQGLAVSEVVSIGMSAAATLFLLDRLAPGISGHVRTGAGFGIGSKLVTV